MKFNLKKLLFYIGITFLIGNLFVFFVMNGNFYDSLNKWIEVPKVVFPIVWSILFLIMGITSYVIDMSEDVRKKEALTFYFIQLGVNSLWTLLFFGLKLYFISFLWIILLIALVIVMIVKFYRINKKAGLWNIFYLLWLVFASVLNFSIAILN